MTLSTDLFENQLEKYLKHKGKVIIPLSEYKKLKADEQLLQALDECGVDNWEGWSDACDLVESQED